MKRFILFAALSLFLNNAFAGNPIDLKKDPPPPPPYPTSFTEELPVSASIDEMQLSVYFECSVGDATITVYDSTSQIVYQETVDTDSILDVFIDTNTWNNGNYTIKISYGTTHLIGEFAVE